MDSGRVTMQVRAAAERVRTSLWFLPTIGVVGAVLVAGVLTRVSVAPDSVFGAFVFGGGPTGARGMLQAIAGSVITVTSLVFTMTVVTLQLASSQFSPRLLRTFLRDRGNQVVLSLFLATFAYSLMVLRTIRADRDGEVGFVPQLAVTGAFILAMASVAALVYFVHHITSEIRVDSMMQEVERDTRRTIEHVYPDEIDAGAEPDVVPQPPPGAVAVLAPASGFVQNVAVDSLAERAMRHDVILRVHPPVGGAVSEGTPLVWVWTENGSPPGGDAIEDVRKASAHAVAVGHERTEQRDVAFGLRQLVDIAAKALSPGVNDPTTATHAVAHMASLLCLLTKRQLGDLVRRDDKGNPRVGVQRPTIGEYLELACGQVRRYGAGEPAVVKAQLALLRDVAACSSTDDARDAVTEQIQLLMAATERDMVEPKDREEARLTAAAVERALAGDLRP